MYNTNARGVVWNLLVMLLIKIKNKMPFITYLGNYFKKFLEFFVPICWVNPRLDLQYNKNALLSSFGADLIVIYLGLTISATWIGTCRSVRLSWHHVWRAGGWFGCLGCPSDLVVKHRRGHVCHVQIVSREHLLADYGNNFYHITMTREGENCTHVSRLISLQIAERIGHVLLEATRIFQQ